MPDIETLGDALDRAERTAAEYLEEWSSCRPHLDFDNPEYYAARRARDKASRDYSQAVFKLAKAKAKHDVGIPLAQLERERDEAEAYLDAVEGLVTLRELHDANAAFCFASDRFDNFPPEKTFNKRDKPRLTRAKARAKAFARPFRRKHT